MELPWFQRHAPLRKLANRLAPDQSKEHETTDSMLQQMSKEPMTAPFRFPDLPAELRLLTYEFYFLGTTFTPEKHAQTQHGPAILLVSRQMHAEVKAAIRRVATLTVNLDQERRPAGWALGDLVLYLNRYPPSPRGLLVKPDPAPFSFANSQILLDTATADQRLGHWQYVYTLLFLTASPPARNLTIRINLGTLSFVTGNDGDDFYVEVLKHDYLKKPFYPRKGLPFHRLERLTPILFEAYRQGDLFAEWGSEKWKEWACAMHVIDAVLYVARRDGGSCWLERCEGGGVRKDVTSMKNLTEFFRQAQDLGETGDLRLVVQRGLSSYSE